MGYPNFNLTTIQLPAPTSNLTKAEYKAAYGIDLDAVNIKSFKLVIFGNDKYAIDQIKEVEDGYEIYFNGRILSITDIVQTSDEVYDVANAKPVYYHPIFIRDNVNWSRITLAILDNSPVAYTWNTLKAKLKSLMDAGASIQVNGVFTEKSNNYACQAFIMILDSTNYNLYGFNEAQNNQYSLNLDDITASVFTDGVNKIN